VKPATDAAVAFVECPECQAVIPVAVADVETTTDSEGRQFLNFKPDMSDLWAHFWTHAADLTL
jgi:hypothetical protein